MAFLSCGLVGQVNHLANPNRDRTQIATVQETDYHKGRRSTSYTCTVVLEDGEQVELTINRQLYQQLQPGDALEICEGDGALGIRYCFVPGA